MQKATFILRTVILLASVSVSVNTSSQIYEQAFLLNKLPKIPDQIIGVSETEIEQYRQQLKSVMNYLDSLEKSYKHPMCSLEKSSQKEMFEFEELCDDLYKLHDRYQGEKAALIYEKIGALSLEEGEKRNVLSNELHSIRQKSSETYRDISQEENRIDKELYDNQAKYNQRKAALLTKHILEYKGAIEQFAIKTKRADTILLASIMQNVSCAAITNTKYLLMTCEGYLSLFMPPYTPKFGSIKP